MATQCGDSESTCGRALRLGGLTSAFRFGPQAVCSEASPRPASGSSRKTSSSARSASPEERQVSTANEAQVWAAPRRPPAGAEASQRWLEEMDNLQRDYNEVLRSIDARFSQRMNTLRGQLESSMSHELPPSYPPSDVSRETEPELVETDPEVVSP
ncbi:unnamed protein product [Effrenium voratum]|uniref:Uncharacterized protein n=1 Tax=Effrenium voratum TaxID=2562239 RepID=A0AA36MH72_9DINO|nr:unnamed protein product [Effrenium voratum]